MTTGRINQVTRVETPISVENFGEKSQDSSPQIPLQITVQLSSSNSQVRDFSKESPTTNDLPVRQLTTLG